LWRPLSYRCPVLSDLMRPGLRAGALLAALALAMVVLAPVASAHDELVSTSPQDGSSLAAPGQVVLRFTNDLLPIGNRVRVEGPAGPASNPSAKASGPTLTASLDPDLPAGAHRVTWRAVSADGHPLSGTFGFTRTQPTTASTTSEPTATAPATAPSVPSRASRSGELILSLAALGALVAGLVVAVRRARRQGRG